MPLPKKPIKPYIKKKSHTPREIPIDWKIVESLIQCQCTGAQIAAHFGLHPETLYDRVKKEFGIHYTDYSYKFKEKGLNSLKAKQYQKAMTGDNVMLVWLGKNLLGQRDSEDKNKESPQHEELKNLLLELKNANKSQADQIIQRSDETPEHMGGCSPVREDLQLDSETY